jgi:signal transduction histidine kinase
VTRRILVVDDIPEIRESVAELLARIDGFELVGHAGNGVEAVRAVDELLPDVVLMDLQMPLMNGVEATRRIHDLHPEIAILMHSAYAEEPLVAEALAAGASGYVVKGGNAADLVRALEAVHAGAGFLSESISRPVFERLVELYGNERTARRDAEAREQRLADLYAREREVAEGLRALTETKNAFLVAISHELRTPLTCILGSALTLGGGESHIEPDVAAKLMDAIVRNAQKLDRLLADLLDVDRVRAGLHEANRREIDVTELVRATVEEWSKASGRTATVSGTATLANLDAAKVERIVENLLWNASRHAHPSATIWVGVEGYPGGTLLVVEDDGDGVPDDMKERIFEPFVQGPARQKHSPGTGIGLSLVRRCAEMHGGRAWVEDRHGGGASFRVRLPDGTTPS